MRCTLPAPAPRTLLLPLVLLLGLLFSPRPAAAALTWLLPSGGEVWTAGTTHTIEWSGGIPTNNVDILLIQVTPFQLAGTIVPIMLNTGAASWTIPVGLSGSYQVFVEEPATNDYAYSNTITVQPAPLCALGCQLVSATQFAFTTPPTGVCATTGPDALALASVTPTCPVGWILDPSSIVVDRTLLPVGVCYAGYSGAFVAEASAVACCCPGPTSGRRSTWGSNQTQYR